ncbi:MAG TPA: hypothetical protein PKH33_17225 [bacterium]|nr:hypothetical protein [bacterium]
MTNHIVFNGIQITVSPQLLPEGGETKQILDELSKKGDRRWQFNGTRIFRSITGLGFDAAGLAAGLEASIQPDCCKY